MNLELNKDLIKYIVYTISIILAIDYYINNKLLLLIFFIILSGIIYYSNNSIVIALTLSIIISNLVSLQVFEGNTNQRDKKDKNEITPDEEKKKDGAKNDIQALPTNGLVT